MKTNIKKRSNKKASFLKPLTKLNKKTALIVSSIVLIIGMVCVYYIYAAGQPQVPPFPRYAFSDCRNGPCDSSNSKVNQKSLHSSIINRTGGRPGPWRIMKNGGSWGPYTDLPTASHKLAYQLIDASYGAVFWIENEAAGTKGTDEHPRIKYRITKEKYIPGVINTVGTYPIDVQHTGIIHESEEMDDIGARSMGIASCRKIAGSSSWSQHAFNNAEDWGAPSMEKKKKIAMFFRKYAATMHVEHIIFNRKVWSRGDSAYNWENWHTYTGEDPHTSHVHIDMTPNKGGTPACAR